MLSTLLLIALLVTADEGFSIGILATHPDATGSLDQTFVVAAHQAVLERNEGGGLLDREIELLVEDTVGTIEGTRAAVGRLAEKGVVAIIGPLDVGLSDAAVKSAMSRKIPVVAIGPPVETVTEAIVRTLVDAMRVPRIAVLSGQHSSARALKKELAARLSHPYRVVHQLDITVKRKAFFRKLEKEPVGLLLLDATPDQARDALTGTLADSRLPVVLTPRSFGEPLFGLDRELFVVLGRALSTVPGGSPLLKQYRRRTGEPGFGVAEGYEAASLVMRAVETAGSTRPAILERTLAEVSLDGPRGPVALAGKEPRLAPPLGLWRLRAGRAEPYLPPAIPEELVDAGTSALKETNPDLGVRFGEWRSDTFHLAEKTQWVLVTFGEAGETTIDEDLRILGLSTAGQSPLVDHLVKEEVLGRLLAICSAKYLLNTDGSAIPGRSLRISFATHLPPKAKASKAWRALVAGDDEAAGGRAWPGRGLAVTYSSFIRRTIFEEHALDPPVGPADLTFLDGSYRFGTDPEQDLRSEMIRALINGFAGSMALTTAHEVGHLAGLGHITDDPLGIMNVEEGAGIDHNDGHFSVGSLERLTKSLGVVK